MDPGNLLIANADDLAVLITAPTITIFEENIQTAALTITNKLDRMDIHLAPEKSELVVLVGHRKTTNLNIQLGNCHIRPQKAIKYMGVWLDSGMRMTTHVLKIRDRTVDTLKQLTRITPNIRRPSDGKRRMLASVVHSMILYASPIWSRTTVYKYYEKVLEKINRMLALRVVSAYRTVSTEAVLALAKIPPIILQIEERNLIYRHGSGYRSEVRKIILDKWQNRWEAYQGRIKIFIPDVRVWINNMWTKTDYYITQAMTGHGAFGENLFKITKAESTKCWYCEASDTANHTLFECCRYLETRASAEQICKVKMENRENCEAITRMMRAIMLKKQEDEKIKIWQTQT